MTSIHAIRAEDFEEWTALWDGYLRFYESEVPAAVTARTFRRITEGDGVHGAIARDDEGRAIGLVHWLTHASTWSPTDYCYLEDLFVAPGVRGGGVGRALIAHVRDWAAEHGSDKLYWLTQEGNATARALYDRVATHTGFTHYEIAL
ncbi:GNAT family N-acetyltransferase [Microbacterium hydrocarbonoxydans]|uniref:GNAT family N-acetyltransferase n=1 Tax=Microbacterium hydrocarbonoxydans TaxID=273678 RepID=UPI0007BB104D|nr:GNAT family N-acetyltransferase [Microbacterium hydrocarbonoxydans]GAT73396.1 putative acetyltransferase [Microbacterium sp. HM58-2]